MKEGLLKWLVLVWMCHAVCCEDKSGAELIQEIVDDCLDEPTVNCIKVKTKAWLKDVADKDEIKINDNLSIVQNEQVVNTDEQEPRANHWFATIDRFLNSHSLRIDMPKILENSNVKEFIPRSIYENSFAKGLVVPLTEPANEGEF